MDPALVPGPYLIIDVSTPPRTKKRETVYTAIRNVSDKKKTCKNTWVLERLKTLQRRYPESFFAFRPRVVNLVFWYLTWLPRVSQMLGLPTPRKSSELLLYACKPCLHAAKMQGNHRFFKIFGALRSQNTRKPQVFLGFRSPEDSKYRKAKGFSRFSEP